LTDRGGHSTIKDINIFREVKVSSIILREPSLVEEVQRVTEQEGLDTISFVTEAVRRHLATYRQKRIVTETEAWYRLPVAERERYKGKFVAVYQGQVVDSDPDRLKLYFRIRERFGRQTVLIIEGGDYPIPVYRVRSPRRGESTDAH
jgi:hypothetical protein